MPNGVRMIVMKINKASFYNILLFSSVFLLIGIRIFQIRFIPYGSPDDNGLAALSYIHGSLWDGAINQAKSQGRFYQIPYAFMTQLPYLILDHQFLWVVIAIQVIMFNIGLYLAFLSIVPTKVYALFSLVIFNSLFDFRWGYNSINAFPLWFCFSLTCFLFSIRLIYLSNTYTSQKPRVFFRIFGISLCFIAALGYESLLYFPALLILLDFNFWENLPLGRKSPNQFFEYIRYRKATWISVTAFFMFYSTAYFVFRNQNPSDYSGVKLNFSDPLQTVSTIFKMSLSGFNSPYYLNEVDLSSLVLWNLLTIIISAFIFAIFCFQIVARNDFQMFSKASLLIGCSLVFVPNILYGFTQRYRELAQVNPLYLGALFSAPAIIYLFLVGINYSLQTRKFVRVSLIVCMSLLFSLFANINSQNISKYADEMRLRNPTWQLVDCLMSLEPTVPNHRKVLAPDLDDAIGIPTTYEYWDYYFSKHYKVKIEFIEKIETSDPFAQVEIAKSLNRIDLKYFVVYPSESGSLLKMHLSYDKKTEKISYIPDNLKGTPVPTRC
jgi:hypothetical protein